MEFQETDYINVVMDMNKIMSMYGKVDTEDCLKNKLPLNDDHRNVILYKYDVFLYF